MNNMSIAEIRKSIKELEIEWVNSAKDFDAYCEYAEKSAHYEHLLRTTEPMWGLEHPEWCLTKISEGEVDDRYWPHWVKHQIENRRLDGDGDYKDYASQISEWLITMANECLTPAQKKSFYRWADRRNFLSGACTPKATLEAIDKL